MSQTLLFTAGTRPATWVELARDLLKRAPQGVDLALPAFAAWVQSAAAQAEAGGLSLVQWADALPAHDPFRAELAEIAGDRKASWGGLDPRAESILPLLLKTYPRASFLFFVEDPVSTLARAVLQEDNADPSEVLDQWTASTRRLLRQLHASAGRCLVLDANEVRRDPTLATVIVRERFGVAVRDPVDQEPPFPAPDPAALFVAEALARSHTESAAAYEELRAACQPLGDDGGASLRLAVDARAAAARLWALERVRLQVQQAEMGHEQARARRDEAIAERDAAQADAREVLARQHAQQEQLAATLLDRDAVRSSLGALEQDYKALEQRAEQAQKLLAERGAEIAELQKDAEVARRFQATQLQGETALRDQLVSSQAKEATAVRHCDELQAQLAGLREAQSSQKAAHDSVLGQLTQALDRLARTEAERDRLANDLQASTQQSGQQVQQLEQQLQEHQNQVAALGTERDRLMQDIEARIQYARQLQQQLQQRLSELTAATAERERLSSRVAEFQAQQEDLQQKLSQARAETSAAKEQWKQWWSGERERANRLGEQRLDLSSQLQQVRQESMDLRQQLLAQLHQAHAETLGLKTELQRLDERLPHAAAARGAGLDLGTVLLGSERNTPPHRELSFEVPSCFRPGRSPFELRARLVEHRGNPGLVIFESKGGALFDRWEAVGEESGAAFTLLIPADLDSRQRLARLGATDWLQLQALLSALEKTLVVAEPQLAAPWHWVLTRLRAELDALPPGLRYDAASFQVVGDAGSPGLVVRLQGVDTSVRRHARWQLTWWPGRGGGELQWTLDLPAGDQPPLLGWPRDEHGRPVAEHRLKAWASDRADERRDHWLAQPQPDLCLLRLVHAALPDWVQAASRQQLVPAAIATAWAAAAAELQSRIDTDLRVPRWRRLARALRGR